MVKAILYVYDTSRVGEVLGFIDRLGETGLNIEYEVYTSRISFKPNIEKLYLVKGSTSGIARLLAGREADLVIASHGKNEVSILAEYSAMKEIPLVTEVIDVDGGLKRAVIAGRGYADYDLRSKMALTLAPGRFNKEMEEGEPEIVDIGEDWTGYSRIEVREKERGGVDLSAAEIVVGVGRGFKKKEDLEMAFELAELLGGEVGSTRPIAADLKWLSEDRWIGISGVRIKGKLYIAIGISGAPQHIMAASDVKRIVAINKDKNAPIFKYADYGVVADLYQFLPVLIKRLREKLSR